MIHEEEKYQEIIKQLKSLPRVKAKVGFEDRLMQRLREVESDVTHTDRQKSVLERFRSLFKPSFVPAVAVSVVLLISIIVYFLYFTTNKDDYKITLSDHSETEHTIYLRTKEDSYIASNNKIENNSRSPLNNSSNSERSYFFEPPALNVDRTSKDISNLNQGEDENQVVSYRDSEADINKTPKTESSEKVFEKNKDNDTKKRETNIMVYEDAIRSGLPPLAKAYNPVKDSSKQDTVNKKNKKPEKK